MGTQRAIARKIRKKESDCLMAVKRNQGSLHDEIVDQFHFSRTQSLKGYLGIFTNKSRREMADEIYRNHLLSLDG